MLDKATSSKSKQDDDDDSASSVPLPPRKMSLLQKYSIPLDHLDFRYIASCTNPKEIEKILLILRSGEEGYFPDLTTCTETRLQSLDPTHYLLRLENPLCSSSSLPKDERNDLINDISEWIETVKLDQDDRKKSNIWMKTDENIPIRGTELPKKKSISSSPASQSQQRIKSWEYEKWERFNVDEALVRLDVVEQQTQEWEQFVKPKIMKQQKQEEMDENVQKHDEDVTQPSWVEEISVKNEPKESVVSFKKADKIKLVPKQKSCRKVRIQIEDVHIGF